MGEPQEQPAPDPAAAETTEQYVRLLQDLRRWAGQPSLRRLRALGGSTRTDGGDEVDALPTSTTAHLLAGRGLPRLPRLDFVESFVAACLAARRCDAAQIAAERARWVRAWRALSAAATAPAAGQRTGAGRDRAQPPPAQLPPDLPAFTGRDAELAHVLAPPPEDREDVTMITAVDGMAGVGKTALAVRAAHRLAPQYPDGQLFVDLHGYADGTRPTDPADALDGLLRSLGIPGEQIPPDLDGRTALFRSRLAGRRVLILLDNARSESQVRPLLPGAAGSRLIITSRSRLVSLDEARPLSLDVLPTDDAVTLFVRIAGPDRTDQLAADAGRLDEVVQHCGRLPLAIRIAAARLRARPVWTLAHLADRLTDQQHRLSELDAGDRGVASAFALSYRDLSAEQQRLFRLLVLPAGPDVDSHAAAALADLPTGRAGRLLEGLLDAHLLQQHTPGRYRFHDLIRAYAAQTAAAEPAAARHAATTRLLDHYTRTAAAAMSVLYPFDAPRRPPVDPPDARTPPLPDGPSAASWLDAELPNLLAAAHGTSPVHTIQLAAILHGHLRIRADLGAAEALHRYAVQVALVSHDRDGERAALICLGDTHVRTDHYEQAIDCFDRALAIARAGGAPAGELHALLGRGQVHYLTSRHAPAIAGYEQALGLARQLGDRSSELTALCGLGQVHRITDHYEQAVDCFDRALTIAREIGDRRGEGQIVGCLGAVHRMTGRQQEATTCYERALGLARQVGDRSGELYLLFLLGDIHYVTGDHGQASDYLHRALDMASQIGDRTIELHSLVGLGHLDRAAGRHVDAVHRYQCALDLGALFDARNGQYEALLGLGATMRAADRPDEALTHYTQALDLAVELEQPMDQARAHDGLGHAHRALGDTGRAGLHWQCALDIFRSLDAPEAEDVRASLSGVATHSTVGG
jgi:tetratricopeptide (TPR) repeat protein